MYSSLLTLNPHSNIQSQTSTNLHSVSADSSFLENSAQNHIDHAVCSPHIWLLSLSIPFLRVITAIVSILKPFLLLNYILLYGYTTFNLPINCLIDIWTNSTLELLWIMFIWIFMYMMICLCVNICFHFSWVDSWEGEFLGSTVSLYLTFSETGKLFPKAAVPHYGLRTTTEES